jgi:hypothetical protein
MYISHLTILPSGPHESNWLVSFNAVQWSENTLPSWAFHWNIPFNEPTKHHIHVENGGMGIADIRDKM